MYRIKVERVNDEYHMVGTNERGNEVHMDSTLGESNGRLGAGPMQLLIMGLGGCSGIDVLSILKKSRQKVEDFSIDLTAKRMDGEIPSLFEKIHVHFTLTGDLDSEKVRRAIELSIGKYCSVAETLRTTAEITFSYTVNEVDYA